MTIRIPSYRYHKARNCAVTTIAGKDHYLGAYDSPESREKYHRLVAEHLAAPLKEAQPTATHPLTVVELIDQYWEFAQGYYVKDGRPTGEIYPLKEALRFLRRLYGLTPAIEFSPLKLKAIREAMIVHPITRSIKIVDAADGTVRLEKKVIRTGLTRRVVNKQIGRVKRVFAWAVQEELVPPEVHAALLRVSGLKKGRTEAREKPRVQAVDVAIVKATLAKLGPTVRAMVEIQRLSGCRPQEVVCMRGEEIDTAASVWEYRPSVYKTEHHNDVEEADRARVIFLGPHAQDILRPFLTAAAGGFLFVPERHIPPPQSPTGITQTTPLLTRASKAPKSSKPSRTPRDRYSVDSYRKPIVRARRVDFGEQARYGDWRACRRSRHAYRPRPFVIGTFAPDRRCCRSGYSAEVLAIGRHKMPCVVVLLRPSHHPSVYSCSSHTPPSVRPEAAHSSHWNGCGGRGCRPSAAGRIVLCDTSA